MQRLPVAKLRRLAKLAANAKRKGVRGALLEQFAEEFFESLPGVECIDRNIRPLSGSGEIDRLFWNDRISRTSLSFLDTPFLVECKNHGKAAGNQDVIIFAKTLRSRGCRDGILVTSKGISGNPRSLRNARYEIAIALHDGQRILVLTVDEILAMKYVEAAIQLLKVKLVELIRSGTSLVD